MLKLLHRCLLIAGLKLNQRIKVTSSYKLFLKENYSYFTFNNKDIIDNYESLSIMHSVLSILNLMLDNLDLDFAELGKIINVTSNYKRNMRKT